MNLVILTLAEGVIVDATDVDFVSLTTGWGEEVIYPNHSQVIVNVVSCLCSYSVQSVIYKVAIFSGSMRIDQDGNIRIMTLKGLQKINDVKTVIKRLDEIEHQPYEKQQLMIQEREWLKAEIGLSGEKVQGRETDGKETEK
ncbi:MAG: hypothetical protein JXR95_07755 [Deltaproteobacteria bacterium]|nr:hypothetical protein [Deltaproteobacteria bacterium]